MITRVRHPWDVSYQKAIKIQQGLRDLIKLDLPLNNPRYIAGTDVSVSRGSTKGWAGVVVFSYPELTVVEEQWAEGHVSFPYVPGLLSFREIPLLLTAIEKLSLEPDLFLCDGQGIAHPRRMGIATHLGVILDKPTVGCAKSRLIGTYDEVGPEKGNHSVLFHNGEKVGAVLRTKSGVKPIFVSPGYAISLKDAIKVVLSCTPRYRIPEPIRAAHNLVTRLRRSQDLV